MRIGELSSWTGVSVATIKFYLREGLLPGGTPSGSNQADYSDVHVRRLRLIRILTQIGGLSLRRVAEVLRSLNDASAAYRALGPEVEEDPGEDFARALDDTNRFVDEDLGWRVHEDAPGRRALARALAALRQTDGEVNVSVLRPYARAADWLATEEAPSPHERAGADRAERTIARTVVYESALMALRRLAHEHRAATDR